MYCKCDIDIGIDDNHIDVDDIDIAIDDNGMAIDDNDIAIDEMILIPILVSGQDRKTVWVLVKIAKVRFSCQNNMYFEKQTFFRSKLP